MGMSDLNHWVGEGRLTRNLGDNERDFGYIQNGGDGMAVATISIAVNRSRKKNNEYVDEASFFDVKIYGKTAENLKPYLTKGQLVRVEGMLKQDRWQDKQTGNNMSKIYINAISVRLIGGKRDEGGNSQQSSSRAPQFTPANNQQNPQPQNNGGYQNQQQSDFKEDIPWDSGNDYPSDIPF